MVNGLSLMLYIGHQTFTFTLPSAQPSVALSLATQNILLHLSMLKCTKTISSTPLRLSYSHIFFFYLRSARLHSIAPAPSELSSLMLSSLYNFCLSSHCKLLPSPRRSFWVRTCLCGKVSTATTRSPALSRVVCCAVLPLASVALTPL